MDLIVWMGETGVNGGLGIALWEVEWVLWLRGIADNISVLSPASLWTVPVHKMISHPKSPHLSLPERFFLAVGMYLVCGQVQNAGELIHPGLALHQPG